MIGYYNYTVILTYLGTLSGFAGMASLFGGNLKNALLCLIVSGICDMFDGKIASTRKRTRQEKRFGIQIDSLSDLICFGALPALIVFSVSSKTVFPLLISCAYLLCALIRLAFYNVDEEERQEKENNGRQAYLGLPVTASALLLPLFFALSSRMGFSASSSVWLLALIAAAFITPVKLKKPALLGKIVMLLLGAATLALSLLA